METKEPVALAFDLGGTKIRAALVDRRGEILHHLKIPTPKEREGIMEAFREGARAMREHGGDRFRLVGTGVGTAGAIEPEGGVIHYAPNLPLDGFPLGRELAAFCPGPVSVLNDGRAAALGEYTFGKLKGLDPMVCLFFGTGIGIGVVLEGRILSGTANASGEIGHTIFRPEGPLCRCGKKGCFEALCGGGPMVERALREIGPAPGGGEWTVGGIVAAAKEGNAAAWKILSQALEAFQVLTANLVTLFNPAALVLGGGVLEGWPDLYGLVEKGIQVFCLSPVKDTYRMALSELGSDAILKGAAALAFQAAEAGGKG